MGFWARDGAGLRVDVRATPNAGLDAITGVVTRADGRERLAIKVRAVPDKGQANAAVIALLAKALALPKSAISVKSGATGRDKVLMVSSGDRSVRDALERLGAGAS